MFVYVYMRVRINTHFIVVEPLEHSVANFSILHATPEYKDGFLHNPNLIKLTIIS